jgi:hypothetical protein
MNTLEYEYDGERHEVKLPSSFADLSGDQLVAAVRLMDGEEEALRVLTGLPEDVWDELSAFQRYSICELFEWMLRPDPGKLKFREWKIPTLDVDGEVWYGPMSNMANITWGEFVYADQCMMQGYYRAVVAALFRQERKGYDGETDRRVPFTTYGTTRRFERLAVVASASSATGKDANDGGSALRRNGGISAMEMAVILNYRAVRAASLEATYTEIFPYHDDNTEADDGPNDNPLEPEETEKGQFSWTNIHRNLLGDNIQDEEKFLQLPVHTVLHRLNQLIIDNKKRK